MKTLLKLLAHQLLVLTAIALVACAAGALSIGNSNPTHPSATSDANNHLDFVLTHISISK